MLRVARKVGADADDLRELSNQFDRASAEQAGERASYEETEWSFEESQAGLGFISNGRLTARVYLGADVQTGQLYYGFRRVSNNPVIHFMGVKVEYSSGSTQELHFGRCGANNCLKTFERPGESGYTDIRIPIEPVHRGATLEAFKSGSMIQFRYQTKDSFAQNQRANYSLSLKGSRVAIEQVERDAAIISSYAAENPTTPLPANTPDKSISTAQAPTTNSTAKLIDPTTRSAGGKFSGTPVTCFYASAGISPAGIHRELNRLDERSKQVNAAVISEPTGKLVLQYIWGAVVYNYVSDILTQELYSIIEQRDYYTGTTECLSGDFEYETVEAVVAGHIARASERSSSVASRREIQNWRQRIIHPRP